MSIDSGAFTCRYCRMVHWVEHLYGPRNKFEKCANCKKEFPVDILKRYNGRCPDCALSKPADAAKSSGPGR